jgi:hypothetical protein
LGPTHSWRQEGEDKLGRWGENFMKEFSVKNLGKALGKTAEKGVESEHSRGTAEEAL